MDRLVFETVDGKRKVYYEEVTEISAEDGKRRFKVKDRPVYVHLHFMRDPSYYELTHVYRIMASYKLIGMLSESKIKEMVDDDLKHVPLGKWEIKCDFENAFECCRYALPLVNESAEDPLFEIQITSEPSEDMGAWLSNGGDKIDKIIEDLKYRVEKDQYIDVGPGAEVEYGVSDEEFNSAVNNMCLHGYKVTSMNLQDKPRCTLKILSRDSSGDDFLFYDILANKKRWYKHRRELEMNKIIQDELDMIASIKEDGGDAE